MYPSQFWFNTVIIERWLEISWLNQAPSLLHSPGESDDSPGPREDSFISSLHCNATFLWKFPKMFYIRSYYLRLEFIFTPNWRNESLNPLLNYAFSGYFDPWSCENVHIQGEFSDSKIKEKTFCLLIMENISWCKSSKNTHAQDNAKQAHLQLKILICLIYNIKIWHIF